ncbi:hypothetical protein AV530_005506 [Patagioenas fasciata monilis]|uniref:Uncharacterized protein n=1 Tax=Patagioenas fasciata monilis TaxID=372326 RepID=A0A1V4JM24_PATFA|nr:hypothetical protein AV530_005506 [Patagioenas fasciata monilis]
MQSLMRKIPLLPPRVGIAAPGEGLPTPVRGLVLPLGEQFAPSPVTRAVRNSLASPASQPCIRLFGKFAELPAVRIKFSERCHCMKTESAPKNHSYNQSLVVFLFECHKTFARNGGR